MLDKLTMREEKLLLLQTFGMSITGMLLLSIKGMILKANSFACNLLGFSKEQLCSRHLEDLLPQDDRESALRLFDQLLIQESFQMEQSLLHSNGHNVWTEMNVSLIKIDKEKPEYCLVQLQDITIRKRAQSIIEESESAKHKNDNMYRMIAEYSTDLISRHRIDGIYLYVSPACKALLGYEPEELLGRQTSDFFHPGDVEPTRKAIRNSQTEITAELNRTLPPYRIRKKNGTYIWFESQARAVLDEHGEIKEVLTISRDISLRKNAENQLLKSNKKLKKISFVDALTEVANRRFFDETFLKEWRNGIRFSTPLSIILIDIDHFKRYNDSLGHNLGDRCLYHVAQALKASIKRPGDFIARFGGEEFVIVLPQTDREGAMLVAKLANEQVEALKIKHSASDVSEYITASGGCATMIPVHDSGPSELFNQADKALYRAKREGRNRIIVHD